MTDDMSERDRLAYQAEVARRAQLLKTRGALTRSKVRQILGGLAMLSGRDVHVEQDGNSLIFTLDPGATNARRNDLQDDITRALAQESASDYFDVMAFPDRVEVRYLLGSSLLGRTAEEGFQPDAFQAGAFQVGTGQSDTPINENDEDNFFVNRPRKEAGTPGPVEVASGLFRGADPAKVTAMPAPHRLTVNEVQGGFQPGAFQADAFQVGPPNLTAPSGDHLSPDQFTISPADPLTGAVGVVHNSANNASPGQVSTNRPHRIASLVREPPHPADTPQSPPPRGPQHRRRVRTPIGKAVLRNHADITLLGAAFLSLIEDKILTLRQERPNSDQAKAHIAEAIANCEDLKSRVERFLDTASGFVRQELKEEAVKKSAMSFADGVSNWWSKRHVEFCDKASDMGLFLTGLTACSLAGVVAGPSGLVGAAISGALVGGKPVVDAIKAAAKSMAKHE